MISGALLFLIFFALACLHMYWGLGGRWGADAAVPVNERNEKMIKPKMRECFIVALWLLIFAFFVLIRSRILPLHLPFALLNYGMWIIAILFIVRAIGEFKYVGFFKKIKTSRFAELDTKYYSPLCLFIGILALILQFFNR